MNVVDPRVLVQVCEKQLSFLLKWLGYFLFPPAVTETFCHPMSTPALDVCLSMFCVSIAKGWVSYKKKRSVWVHCSNPSSGSHI